MNKKLYTEAGELIVRDFPSQESVWGSVIQDREIVLLFAKTGVGKTHVALELAHAIGANRRFLKFKGSKARRVLYCDGEMGLRGLKRRLEAIESGCDTSIRGDMLRFMSFESFGGVMPNLATDEGQAIYSAAADMCEVIVVDNLNCCSLPVSNRDDEIARWHRVHRWASRMRAEGRTVIFIHHTNKGALLQSGTVLKENSADTVIRLQEPMLKVRNTSNLRMELHFDKHRNFWGADKEPLVIELIEAEGKRNWNWALLADEKKMDVALMLSKGSKEREIAEMLDMSLFTTRMLIKEISADEERLSLGVYHDAGDRDQGEIF
jgi:hypothetical protein